ncbi:hypothetical protein HAX54_029316 [Datura stramonium]|uniref:Uncharacterized protein n=1 Tax=Datura stramonium TaxID=4076 RepID=A0ABS8V5N1_DATST|nr:hypothetical protein [Datura stramonium]
MARTVARSIAAPLLFLNLIMYLIVLGFASWCLNRLACKEINIGGWRGWRLRVLEGFTIVLAFTQLLYVLLLHAGMFSSRYGPGYRETEYGTAAGAVPPGEKGGGVPTTGV